MPLQISELLQPIPGENPGGADIRYEPVFDQIKRARVEEDVLPTGDWARERKTADWGLIIKLAPNVLAKQSKDLQIAAWLAEALLKREGIGGLKSGIELLRGLIESFWDHLYPVIEEDDLEYRAAPLDWVGQYLDPVIRLTPIDKAGHSILDYRESRAIGYEKDKEMSDERDAWKAAVAAGKLSAEAFDQAFEQTPKAWYKQLLADIDGTNAAIDALDKVSREKFADVAPRFTPLRNALSDVRQIAAQLLARRLETDPDPPEPVVTEEVAEGAAEGQAGAPGVAGGISPTPKTRADAEARVAAAARFLRAENPTDPAPYLMLRGLRWGELRIHGANVEPKQLAAPPTDLRSRLRGLLLDARWADLLEGAEDVMATPFGRGWLDLQRYVLTACAGLGSDYDNVAAAIRGALQSLLRDLPQLPTLMLMDDTPTGNPETQNWLRGLAPGAETIPGPDLREAAAAGDGRSAGRGVYERAMERVRAGEPERGVEMLMRAAAQERSERERFMRRSEAASIMVDAGREAVARPILEDLMREIDKHTLEEWEAGDTVAHALGLLYRCLRKMDGESSTTQSLYLRICKLDPMQAIQITAAPPS
jgi:type VI secretion system protein ImpA